MVEPFDVIENYDYDRMYNHIHETFVASFPSIYYREDKPLICFFNNETLTPNGFVPKDSRFKTMIVGHEPYVQWIYTDLNCNAKPNQTHGGGQTSVTLRYDDSRLNRLSNCTVDPELSQGTYEIEWENAIQLWKNGSIDTITITSWNEYPERTAIEPHYDGTAENKDPYYSYNLTKEYISQVHPLSK